MKLVPPLAQEDNFMKSRQEIGLLFSSLLFSSRSVPYRYRAISPADKNDESSGVSYGVCNRSMNVYNRQGIIEKIALE